MNSLPISVVPNTDPPRFRWRQTVSTPNGPQVVDHEGTLPPAIEEAVALTVSIARQTMHECAMLRGECDGLRDKLAEALDPPQAPPKPTVASATVTPPLTPKKGR